jgi:hypothetical protein
MSSSSQPLSQRVRAHSLRSALILRLPMIDWHILEHHCGANGQVQGDDSHCKESFSKRKFGLSCKNKKSNYVILFRNCCKSVVNQSKPNEMEFYITLSMTHVILPTGKAKRSTQSSENWSKILAVHKCVFSLCEFKSEVRFAQKIHVQSHLNWLCLLVQHCSAARVQFSLLQIFINS